MGAQDGIVAQGHRRPLRDRAGKLPSLQASLDVADRAGGVIEAKRVRRFVDLSTVGSGDGGQNSRPAGEEQHRADRQPGERRRRRREGYLAVMASEARVPTTMAVKPALDVIRKSVLHRRKPSSAQTMRTCEQASSPQPPWWRRRSVVMGVKGRSRSGRDDRRHQRRLGAQYGQPATEFPARGACPAASISALPPD